jgi:hypothetical protein
MYTQRKGAKNAKGAKEGKKGKAKLDEKDRMLAFSTF